MATCWSQEPSISFWNGRWWTEVTRPGREKNQSRRIQREWYGRLPLLMAHGWWVPLGLPRAVSEHRKYRTVNGSLVRLPHTSLLCGPVWDPLPSPLHTLSCMPSTDLGPRKIPHDRGSGSPTLILMVVKSPSLPFHCELLGGWLQKVAHRGDTQ